MAADALGMARRINDQLEEYINRTLAGVAKSGEAIAMASHEVARSWSGSAAGYHGALYYGRFEKPPLDKQFNIEWGGIRGIHPGWRDRPPEEVKGEIKRLAGAGILVDSVESDAKSVREALENFQNEFVIAFAGFAFDDATRVEKELFDKLAVFTFAESLPQLVKARMPGVMTRDSGAGMQGIMLPAHLYYEGVGDEAVRLNDGARTFAKLADRLVRQLEAKVPVSPSPPVTVGLERLHPAIYSKCRPLYEGAAYAEAAEKGFKVVRDRLRELTGYETGSDAFGKGRLYIRGAAAPNVDRDFNDAVKFLAMAIDRFRNEKSHSSDATIDDAVRAYEYLSLGSLAMHLLDRAETRSP